MYLLKKRYFLKQLFIRIFVICAQFYTLTDYLKICTLNQIFISIRNMYVKFN